jgi:molybdenum cofactor guanylyltransferase
VTGSGASAVILAGGRSSRFGRDKLVEPVDGRPLVEYAIDAVRPLTDDIVVVTAPDSALDLPAGLAVVHDPVAFEGPLVGLRAGLLVVRHARVLVIGGDMPAVVGAVATMMLARLADPSIAAVVLELEGRPRPLPLAVRRDPALDRTARLIESGERRLWKLVEVLEARVVGAAAWRRLDPDGSSLRDIDTPADLD